MSYKVDRIEATTPPNMNTWLDYSSSNLFETRHVSDCWRPEVVKKWNDEEIAKVIVALRERLLGTEEYKTSQRQPILLKTDRSITMNTNIDDVSILAFASFQIKNFKITELEIGEHKVNLEKPIKMASDTIVARAKNRGNQSFEEIRNGVRSAIENYCVGSKELNLRDRVLSRRSDGSYTLNSHEDDITHLGAVHYKVDDFKVTRIAIGRGFEDAPEIRAAFEGHDL